MLVIEFLKSDGTVKTINIVSPQKYVAAGQTLYLEDLNGVMAHVAVHTLARMRENFKDEAELFGKLSQTKKKMLDTLHTLAECCMEDPYGTYRVVKPDLLKPEGLVLLKSE